MLSSTIDKISAQQWDHLVIHYEPVWAIGTGKVPSPEEIQEVHEMMREWVADNVSREVADKIRIIYGGSVNEKNYAKIIEKKDVDGLVLGRVSLTPALKEIVEGCNSISKSI